MKKAPTALSRFVAFLGLGLLLLIYTLYGWVNASFVGPTCYGLGGLMIALMLLAKIIRERYGRELLTPAILKNEINSIATLEATSSLIAGISVTLALIVSRISSSKKVVHIVLIVSAGLVILVFLINTFTAYRYKKLTSE